MKKKVTTAIAWAIAAAAFPVTVSALPADSSAGAGWDWGIGAWSGSGNEAVDGADLLNDRFQQARGFVSRESRWGDNSLSLGYAGTFTRFTGYDDFSYSLHDLTADIRRPLESINGDWGGGLVWSGRYDKGIYEYFDYRDLTGYLTARGYPLKSLLLKGTYRLKGRGLPAADYLNSVDNQLDLQMSRFFRTRTTVRAGLTLGYRSMAGLAAETADYGSGMGWGRMGGGSARLTPGIGRLDVSLRLAQSLGDFTGTWIEAGYNSVSGSGDYESLADYGYYMSDEILQDGYLYRSAYAAIGFRHIFSFGLDLNATASYHDRYYPFTPLYSSDGEPLGANRDDSLGIIGIYGSQSLDPFHFGPVWSVDFGLARRIDRSNDPYYDYDRSSFYLGMRASF